jgi:hypothetical protein
MSIYSTFGAGDDSEMTMNVVVVVMISRRM